MVSSAVEPKTVSINIGHIILYKSLSEVWSKQCLKILMHSLSNLELTK